MRTIKLRAHAKLNLILEVVGLRPDGFHDLRTVMHEIDLADDVRVSVSEADTAGGAVKPVVACKWAGDHKGPLPAGLPSETENIAYRATELFLAKARALRPLADRRATRSAKTRTPLRIRSEYARVNIEIRKRIPLESGMGGGSSDAAAVLVALNRLFGSPFSPTRLNAIAASLGSDVPFFLHGGTALCSGRGEQVKPLKAPPRFHFVLLAPAWGISTADVYKAWDRLAAGEPHCPQAADGIAPVIPAKACPRPRSGAGIQPVLRSARLLRSAGFEPGYWFNSLEPPAFRVEPRMSRLKREMDRIDFVRVMMTGSGSTLFGLCRSRGHAVACAARLETADLGKVLLARSRRIVSQGD